MKKNIGVTILALFCSVQFYGGTANSSLKKPESKTFAWEVDVLENQSIITNKIEGVYKTDFDNLSIVIEGNRVSGYYEQKYGKLDGILKGHTLTGTWVNSGSGNKGRFEFVFNDDFSAFTGKWNYENNPLTKSWNGTKIGGIVKGGGLTSTLDGMDYEQTNAEIQEIKIAGTYQTDFKTLILTNDGKYVTGVYENGNGSLQGVLEEHVFSGNWTNRGSGNKGKFSFVFNTDYSEFKGKWGYNNDVLSRKWDGKKTYDAVPSGSLNSKMSGLSFNKQNKPESDNPSGKKLTGGVYSSTSKPISGNAKIEGAYKTTFKLLNLKIDGNNVTGLYENNNGSLSGKLIGNTLSGSWDNKGSKKQGKFEFVFSNDFSSFTGKWGYNNDPLTRTWNGNK